MLPHKEWLFKADHDLKSSQILLKAEEPLLDIAIYHTQQCGEKALKAFLAYHRKEISRTHRLKTLLEDCRKIDGTLDSIIEECIFLEPFATLYRYPEGELLPKREEVEEAIINANSILNFIKEIIK